MKMFGRRREADFPGQDLLVPPELQQYYHVHHGSTVSGTRKMFAIASVVLVLAAIVIGVVFVVVHETSQPSSNHQNTPALIPNSDKVNTKAVPQPR